MQSTMISPSTQPMASVTLAPAPISSESKIEIKDAKAIQISKEESVKSIKPEEISQEFNAISKDLNLDVKFAYNAKIDTVYINVTDKNTGEIIKKLPTEEAMKIKESMKDLVGVLFDKKG